ncbi:hypothetical protein DNTS_027201 [Danionella cerebrum]|uniref:GTP-binding protein 8 n=1 Tax=Danionella cerebrum TaxID=2873325 RepID=A0A553QQ55_9TELE|nr:hypothetical protein DNTS_027201 [Danionella translucida]TRY91859.1 hypothetical protein DNTS_027201 [Danionella translucida]
MLGLKQRALLQTRVSYWPLVLQRWHRVDSMDKVRVLPERRREGHLFPFKELEKHLSSQVNKAQFEIFHPSLEDLNLAEKLFTPSSKHVINYSTSAVRLGHLPNLKQPEVCFIGRSNVGKSSLIRALFSLAPEVEVRVSKTPGHTKKMNFFTVGKAFCLVDMPGYGYRAPRDFVEMVEPYLQEHHNLVRTFLLVDGSIPLQEADLIAVEMFSQLSLHVMFQLVVTKIDKAGPGTLITHLLQLQDFINTQTKACFPQPFLLSSIHFSGVQLLRCFIAHVTGKLQVSS